MAESRVRQPQDGTHEPLEALVAAFAAATLPRQAWTHAAHLTVGLWAVAEMGEAGALVWLRERIRAYNEATGTTNDDASGYHETITRLYVRALAEHHALHRDLALPDSLALLLRSPLADPAWPLRVLPPERLFSPEARRGWLSPPGWRDAPMGVRLPPHPDEGRLRRLDRRGEARKGQDGGR